MKFSKGTKTIFFIVLGIIIIADYFAPRAHPVFAWDTIPGFWGLFGIVGCFLLIGVSKFIGYKCKILQKENFYKEDNNG